MLDSTPSPNNFPPEVKLLLAAEEGQWSSAPRMVEGGTVTELPAAATVARYIRIEVPPTEELVLWVLHELRFVTSTKVHLAIEPV